MPSFKRVWVFPALLLASLMLAGCGLSLAEDVTPPPNYRPPATMPPAAQPGAGAQPADQPVELGTVFPIVPPDPAAGEAIYAEKCLPCHGATGMGDGPQAGNLPNPAAPIGSPELARQSRPVDWYQIVTVGNLERFMPGFANSLNDRQRWDLVAYAYTLSTSPEELAEGQSLYQSTCASCHGQTGQGDGPRAEALETKPASWTDQSKLALSSANDLVAQMRSGENANHDFAEALTEDQGFAVAAYIRTLGFANAGQPDKPQAAGQNTPESTSSSTDSTPAAGTSVPEGTPAAEGTAVAELPEQITISGKVTNATPGGKVPEGLQVKLTAYESMNPAFDLTAEAAADGSYSFEDVDFKPDYVYFIQVESGGLNFNSDILHGQDVTGEQAELPVEIYDTIADASVLRTDRLHVFFDFSQPGKVQVVNLFIISNPSGRVVVAPEEGKPVITFDLPQGAENLQFQDSQLGERYVQTENGFGDTAAVPPGEGGLNQILYAYELPYSTGLDFQMKVPLPVEAAVVMVPTSGVSLSSSQLVSGGQQDVSGMSFQMYQASSSLQAGDTIDLSLKGKPGSAAAGDAAAADPNTTLIIGLGVFGLALAAAGLYLYFNQRSRQQLAAEAVGDAEIEAAEEAELATETSESLLDKIIALDDQHATGGLPEPAYQARRAELKARLAEALEREKGK